MYYYIRLLCIYYYYMYSYSRCMSYSAHHSGVTIIGYELWQVTIIGTELWCDHLNNEPAVCCSYTKLLPFGRY